MMASFLPARVSFALSMRGSMGSRSRGGLLASSPTLLLVAHIGLCVHANQRLQRTGLRVMHLRLVLMSSAWLWGTWQVLSSTSRRLGTINVE